MGHGKISSGSSAAVAAVGLGIKLYVLKKAKDVIGRGSTREVGPTGAGRTRTRRNPTGTRQSFSQGLAEQETS